MREKLELIKEVGKFIFWDKEEDLRYIHWVSTPLLSKKEKINWVGKILELKNTISDKLISITEPLSSQMNTQTDTLNHIEV